MGKYQVNDTWGSSPAVTWEDTKGISTIAVPGILPLDIANKVVVATTDESHTIRDLMNALGEYGVPSIVTDPEIANRVVPITGYRGTVGKLLDAISTGMEISFTWKDSVLMVGPRGSYVYSVVQDPAVLTKITEDLTSLGAENISASSTTGLLAFDAAFRSDRMIKRYMDRVVDGMGTINLQVSVLTVSLNRSLKKGFDWSSLLVDYRGGLDRVSSDSDTPTDNDGTPTTPTDGVVDAFGNGLKASVDGGLAGLAIETGKFTMSGLFSALSEYGETSTSQNVILKTLPSSEVVIRSGNSIPYVSGISVSGSGLNTGVSGGGLSNNLLGGVQTETVETGITARITPNLDVESLIATLNVELEVKSVVEFVNLSAGNQVGALSQPNVQEQSFNDIARLRLGDTVVLGGIVYEQQTDNRNTLPGAEDLKIGFSDKNTKREAMFIVIRPTANLYRFSDRVTLANGGVKQ